MPPVPTEDASGSMNDDDEKEAVDESPKWYAVQMDPDLARNEYPSAKIGKALASGRPCLAARFATPEIWNLYKDTESSGPARWTLARAINTGVMHPSSFVGCHVGDRESYDDFNQFFWPVIEAYHTGFTIPRSPSAPVYLPTGLDPTRLTRQLTTAAQRRVFSTRIRVARNLAGRPLNPGGSRETREQIAALVEKVCAGFQGELKGDFRRLSKMSNHERQALVDAGHLFRGHDPKQAASGYHEHWPHGRAIFLNHARTFVLWINEGDHLRIIAMEPGGDVVRVFQRLCKGINAMRDGIRRLQKLPESAPVFSFHDKLGNVSCCPSNIGSGMRASVHLKTPNLVAKYGLEGMDAMARERNCQVRGSSGEHSAVVDRVDVSNWRRAGFPEFQMVDQMIAHVNRMAEMEDELELEEYQSPTKRQRVG